VNCFFTLLVTALLVAAPAAANVLPVITNVVVRLEADEIIVSYDVEDPDNETMDIVLRIAGTELRVEPDAPGVSGDIGRSVAGGSGKAIHLPLSTLPENSPDAFVPRILAYDGKGYGGEMIEVDSTTGPDFLVCRYELTNEEFAAFVRTDGYEMMKYWIIDDGSLEIEETGWNYAGKFQWQAPRHWDPKADPPWSSDPYSNRATSPVLGVSWFEAYAYCKWAGYRLPSSSEYLEAAGLYEAAYPWGDERMPAESGPDYPFANVKFGYKGYEHSGFDSDGSEFAAPVGNYSPAGDSPLGIADPLGNVWEWCSDVVAIVNFGTFSCATRPIRGGSWATGMANLEDATKDLCPLYRTDTTGFRCYK
jgi:formylglycine-generating enzyme required for sulfatase activity